jgi:hypothetical protein
LATVKKASSAFAVTSELSHGRAALGSEPESTPSKDVLAKLGEALKTYFNAVKEEDIFRNASKCFCGSLMAATTTDRLREPDSIHARLDARCRSKLASVCLVVDPRRQSRG